MAYQRPMVTVDQNMTTTPTSIERPQPAFVFGPNYELHRYSDEAEKQKISLGKYEGNAMPGKDYPGVLDADNVDANYTKLFGDNVLVQVADLGVASLPDDKLQPSQIEVNGGYTMLLFDDKAYLDYDEDGNPVLRSAVQVGTDTNPKPLPYNLEKGDILVVTYDNSSDSYPADKIVTRVKDVKYSGTGFYLDDDSSSEGGHGTLVYLEDAIPAPVSTVSVVLVDMLQGVEFTRKNLSGGDNPSSAPDPLWQWDQDGYTDGEGVKKPGVNVNGLFAQDPAYFGTTDMYGKVVYADLYLETRELLKGWADSIHNLSGASEVAAKLGAVDPDNPLAMGVYMAALNSATDDGDEAPPVYFMAVESPDAEGYSKVLKRASLTDKVYVFAPTTRDDDILELVRSHVLEMSVKTVKRWRIAAGSAEIPTQEAKLSSANVHGLPYYAIPISTAGSTAVDEGATYNKFRIVKAADNPAPNEEVRLSDMGLMEGDVIKFYRLGNRKNAWDEVVYDTYKVGKVLNNHTVEIYSEAAGEYPITVTGLAPAGDGAYYAPAKIEIFHNLTTRQMAEKAASVSRRWKTRRMLNVFPNYFESGGKTLTGEFAACAVAGLISATEPQQPITNMTIRGIDNIPITTMQYSNADLDEIAAGGTFIVMQDLPDDVVYVRHQITTAYPDGNLNTAELSITKNVDSISYAFAEVFEPYYGKYNVTPELVAILENLAGHLISQLGGSNSVYGPQLIVENTKIKYVRKNELLKDHVDVAITLGVPYPCNNIDIVLTV